MSHVISVASGCYFLFHADFRARKIRLSFLTECTNGPKYFVADEPFLADPTVNFFPKKTESHFVQKITGSKTSYTADMDNTCPHEKLMHVNFQKFKKIIKVINKVTVFVVNNNGMKKI